MLALYSSINPSKFIAYSALWHHQLDYVKFNKLSILQRTEIVYDFPKGRLHHVDFCES